MNNPYRILATAGHVDHGKSSLIKGLTKTDPDRLPEEKKRGITIELGFAHLELPSIKNPQSNYQIGIIDVPGHEDFVKNMVSGVGSIHVVILVVAVDDGWMPQTEEHLQILSYLGVSKGVIALTKTDLVSEEDKELAIEFINEEIQDTFLQEAPIIPISSHTGEGLDDLKEALAHVFDETKSENETQLSRISVDRAFSVKGMGTVITGTLMGGYLKKDDDIFIVPGNIKSRIRSIQTYGDDVPESQPGTRTALNLSHVDIKKDNKSAGDSIKRGCFILSKDNMNSTNQIHVKISRSNRQNNSQYQISRPLKHNSIVRFHFCSANIPARVSLLGKRELNPGESVIAQLKFETKIHVMAGDKFIIRDWPETATLAGGVVLDNLPESNKLNDKKQVELLEHRKEGHLSLLSIIRSQLLRDQCIDTVILTNLLPFSSVDYETSLESLRTEGFLVEINQFLILKDWWNEFIKNSTELILLEHNKRPERIGLKLQSLQSRLKRDGLPQWLFSDFKTSMEKEGFFIKGDFIHHQSHIISLPGELEPNAQKIQLRLANEPFNPGNYRELTLGENDKKAMQFLIDSGEVTMIDEGIVLSNSVFNESIQKISEYLRLNGPSTISQLKESIQASRKIMVPLMEKLDGLGVTIRNGDKRSIP